MKAFGKFVRDVVVLMVGSLVWLHALFILDFVPPSIDPLAHRIGLTAKELLAIGLIIGFSLFRAYGIKRILWDSVCIFFFPFFLSYKAIELWRFLNWRPANELNAWLLNPDSKEAFERALRELNSPKAKVHGAVRGLLRPFFQGMPLWCFLLYATSKPAIVRLCVAVVTLHALSIARRVAALALLKSDEASAIEGRFLVFWSEHFVTVNSWTGDSQHEGLHSAWIKLRLIETFVNWIRSLKKSNQLSVFLGLSFFIAVDVYMSFLVSFIEFGIAKLQGLMLFWRDLWVISMFMPFSYTSLPGDFWIRLAGGLQCVFIVSIGVGTILIYFRKRIQATYQLADRVAQMMDRGEFHKKMLKLNEKFESKRSKRAASAGR